jgi:hypothetical protein
LLCWSQPKTLNAADEDKHRFEYDSGEVEYITTQQLRDAFIEYSSLLSFLNDWERGLFTVTLDEYQRLPATLIDVRKMYNRVIPQERK